ncbi:hypothetical protein D3C80_591940 [compost metagenome]
MNRIARRSIKEGTADEPNDIRIALFGRSEQNNRRQIENQSAIGTAAVIIVIAKPQVQLTTDNWLQTVFRRLLRKFQCTKKIIAISYRDGRCFIGNRLFDDLADRQCAFKQGIGRMYPQMDETR